jgi:hypothetical protein
MSFEIYDERLLERDDGALNPDEFRAIHALVYMPERAGVLHMRLTDPDEGYVRVKEMDEEGDCPIDFHAFVKAWLALRRHHGHDLPDTGRLTEEKKEELAQVFERCAQFIEEHEALGPTDLATPLRAATLELMGMANMPFIEIHALKSA